MRACCYRQWHSRDILFCVLLFVGSVGELIEDRWSRHGGMGMVAPRAIQVYHSFLAQGSPHCMVVVKMWPYLGKKGEKWRRVMCTCFLLLLLYFFFFLLFIVRLLPSHSYAILVMLSRLASRCGEALRSVAYLLHVACVPRTCSLG